LGGLWGTNKSLDCGSNEERGNSAGTDSNSSRNSNSGRMSGSGGSWTQSSGAGPRGGRFHDDAAVTSRIIDSNLKGGLAETQKSPAGSSMTSSTASTKMGSASSVYAEEGGKAMKWQLGPCLGQGAFAQVYQGIDLNTGKFIAVKQVTLRNEASAAAKALRREIDLLCALPDHKHVVRYLGTEQTDDSQRLFIFLEYVSGGSLSDMLQKFGALDESIVSIYTHQVLMGLTFLHSHNVVHCDVKGGNILVSEDGIIKLADFNSSKLLNSVKWGGSTPLASVAGTPQFMAPEVIRQTGHGPSADIWSLGCTVIQMLTAAVPWAEVSNRQTILRKVGTGGGVPAFPQGINDDCRRFLDACFAVDPAARPPAPALIVHAFCFKTAARFSPGDDGSGVCVICGKEEPRHGASGLCFHYLAGSDDDRCQCCGDPGDTHVGEDQLCPMWVTTQLSYQHRM